MLNDSLGHEPWFEKYLLYKRALHETNIPTNKKRLGFKIGRSGNTQPFPKASLTLPVSFLFCRNII